MEFSLLGTKVGVRVAIVLFWVSTCQDACENMDPGGRGTGV